MLDNDQPENVFSASGQVEEQNFDEQQVADPEKQPDVAENTPEKQPDLQAKPDLANNIRALSSSVRPLAKALALDNGLSAC